ncbi:hypothetical protein EH165_04010 [Nakamurella antarctica]|uniref:PH domain-containing protein n=1 Tax=Nakamurella antarctica TaxID=1902245 RepID=A0A3G8ZJB2_9ACTN|nr:hypothetical protein [Nakamurella antarctica]AZI57449.1 hypothetical protein EH165_04010 [Nakamurella antarctica]
MESFRADPDPDRGSNSAVAADFVFRPRVGYFACGLWAVLAVAWIVLAIRDAGLSGLWQIAPASFMGVLVYATCGRPCVIVGSEKVLLRNIIRDVEVPFSQLEAVHTQYALTLLTTQGQKFVAWAAPAASRYSTARTTESDVKTIGWDEQSDGPVPASASLRSDSGSAAAIVRRNWRVARAALVEIGPTPGKVVISWSAPVLVSLAATLLASVVVLAL